MTTVGIILAGGLARRMGGGDKPLQLIGGQTVLAQIIARLAPQVVRLALNANGDPARFAETNLPVIADTIPGNPGPLAGILAGLDWAAEHGFDWLVSAPGDAPFLPADLVARLHAARAGAPLACAASAGRTHPVAALWSTSLRFPLRHSLQDGQRKVETFTAAHGAAIAEWPTAPVDPFFNVNTPQDLAEANRIATVAKGGLFA